jgi:hypothetical protein
VIARERVLVIGAQGVLGRAVARALVLSGFDVLRGGRRPEHAEDFVLLDLDRPETVVEACAGAELVVNCVFHRELAAERAVLRAGGTMLDVASLPLADRRRLEAEAGRARGLVVLHAGLNPGLTTVVLRELLETHPEADGLELVNTLSARQSAGPNSLAFFWPFLTAAAHRPTALIPLPAPFGRRRCLQLSGGAEGWLGSLVDGREGRVYVCLERIPSAGVLALNTLRLLRLMPPAAFAASARLLPNAPRGADGLSREPKCDWVAVTKGGRRLAAGTVEGEGDYKLTVDATVVFCEALADRRAKDAGGTGVVGAEELFSLRELRGAFEQRGIHIREQPV